MDKVKQIEERAKRESGWKYQNIGGDPFDYCFTEQELKDYKQAIIEKFC